MTEHQHPPMGKHVTPPTIKDVVVAALAAPLPCEKCGKVEPCRCYVRDAQRGRVDRKADVIIAALREYGHLPSDPAAPPTLAEIHETARWLAEQSRHPRYAGEGWHRIMQSEADVEVAFAQAARTASNDVLASLNAARRLLDAWRAEHGPEAPR